MTCIHGLDEINCPTCRILKSTVPLKEIKLNEPNFLKADDLIFNKDLNLERKLVDELTSKKPSLSPPNRIVKPTFINEIPNFRNEIFLERVKDLDISKEDRYGITKKIHLENPEWDFEKED